ncbi:MAG: excinuclease ABC subunit UvrA [Planctomycetaceae bacterium]|jgi:excinuclease ABC subunit A|nr:excinuclease ABC subunit UvrA [Planctomycetaceae bacterium]
MIKLRKVSVHNLKNIDLDLPTGKLIVICGRSGSGKSSLAIDTLYAEGQRRYIETFSPYTRQFLEKFEKPTAIQLEGIPVSAAVTGKIDPKFNHGSVGAITGTADYLRLLFSKIGHIFCPNCGSEIAINTPEKILLKLPTILKTLEPNHSNQNSIIETKILIAFEPNILPDRNEFIKTWRDCGFVRCIIFNQIRRIDTSEITTELYDQILQTAEQNKSNSNHNNKRDSQILIAVDRLTSSNIDRLRFIDSVKTAYRYGKDNCCLLLQKSDKMIPYNFAQRLFCADCQLNFPPLDPQLFNPDSPLGACPDCCGGVAACKNIFGKSIDKNKNTAKLKNCNCKGSCLRSEARAVKIDNKNIIELSNLSVNILRKEIVQIIPRLSDYEKKVSYDIFNQIENRLKCLEDVGLGYLSLSRLANTLSEGEGRRAYLSGALGSSLVEIMYVLDEPSVGLHPIDSNRLLELVYKLRDNGNTMIVVEHEDIFLRGADLLVEIGLGAGDEGGNVIFKGTPKEMMASSESLTGRYLRAISNLIKRNSDSNYCPHEKNKKLSKELQQNSQNSNNESKSKSESDTDTESNDESESALKSALKLESSLVKSVRSSAGCIRISGCCGNNLRNISAEFPLGQLCVVTGVSGAGKSTLIFDTLYPAVCKILGKKKAEKLNELPYDKLSISGEISDVTSITHYMIRVNAKRSNPATYLKIFDEIRDVFATTPEAKLRNYGAGRFSFNIADGRCETCSGEGFITVDMQFMPDMYVCCPDCKGRRYRADTLEILYRGKNISEVLNMTAKEAFIFFRGQVKLQRRLKRMIDVGIGYIRIGQRLNTLSSGELQRLKLASYLVQSRRGGSLLLFEEPTTGLHFADIEQLLNCFGMLINMGHSLIVIEHNLQVINAADHIIDIGPGASTQGGEIIAQGTPNEIAKNPKSVIGKYLY